MVVVVRVVVVIGLCGVCGCEEWERDEKRLYLSIFEVCMSILCSAAIKSGGNEVEKGEVRRAWQKRPAGLLLLAAGRDARKGNIKAACLRCQQGNQKHGLGGV